MRPAASPPQKPIDDANDALSAREQAWLAANRDAIAAWNAYVDKEGLPLAGYDRP